MLAPTFMGMASNKFSWSQKILKNGRGESFFFYFIFFLSDSGLNRPIRAETDRYRPKWTEIRVKKKVKKFGKTHRFEASLKKKKKKNPKALSQTLCFSRSLILRLPSLSLLPTTLTLTHSDSLHLSFGSLTKLALHLSVSISPSLGLKLTDSSSTVKYHTPAEWQRYFAQSLFIFFILYKL